MGVNHRRRHFVWLRVRKQFRILLMARSENRRRYKISGSVNLLGSRYTQISVPRLKLNHDFFDIKSLRRFA